MKPDIRIVDVILIEKAIKKLFLKAGKTPTKDVLLALKKAQQEETNKTAKIIKKDFDIIVSPRLELRVNE